MPASVTQRLEAIISANRPRVHGGMRGGFELLAGQTTAEWWKRKAAEELICIRENRSACKALGWKHMRVSAIRLGTVRLQISMAAWMGSEKRRQVMAMPVPLAAE